jgi:hypothetical protein
MTIIVESHRSNDIEEQEKFNSMLSTLDELVRLNLVARS